MQLKLLNKAKARTSKTVQLKVFTTQLRASQMFLDPIQKRALSRSVQLEAVRLEALLYLDSGRLICLKYISSEPTAVIKAVLL